MKKFINLMSVSLSLVLTFIASFFGGGVMMAATIPTDVHTTSDITDGDGNVTAGKTDGGYGKAVDSTNHNPLYSNQSPEGMASTTANREDGDVDFLEKEIDRKITKIRPMSTPIDQISRYAEASSTKQMTFKYFSVGTRPIKTTVKTGWETAPTGTPSTFTLEVTDPTIFTIDDTFRVVGKKAYCSDGKTWGDSYTGGDQPDLLAKVVDKSSDLKLICYCINGKPNSAMNDEPTIFPYALEAGTVIIRLGKACAELDVQTGRFANIPTADTQYCQNFMMQVEQSTFDRISAKNVDWTFSDLEEDGIYDMRLGMEGSFLFGDKGVIKHASKEGVETYFTKGIWWQAGKDLTVGTYSSSTGCVISDDDLVDVSKDLFVGTGSGTKQKVLFCGSDFLAALSKVTSEKFRLKESVESWNLKFKSWDTDFGEILTIHHELFDMNGMSDCAFALDPQYLGKKKFISWTRNVLDLKAAGVRNTDAVVLQEASALYLRYPKAHARLKLATTA